MTLCCWTLGKGRDLPVENESEANVGICGRNNMESRILGDFRTERITIRL